MSTNPLSIYMRQPKIYIRLPSNGQYWEPGSLEVSETGEYPVYSMTAKDELALKIPDALMNGQAVVDVIQHCVPNIKNAWNCPSIDVDMILIAIRLATYGEMMSTPVKIKDLELEYQIDLRTIMDQLTTQINWVPVIPVNDELTIFVKPLTYRHISKAAIQSFETQKIMNVVNDEKMSDEQKLELFKESFNKLTDVTVGTIAASIYKIDTSQGSTDNPKFIKEWVTNLEKADFDIIDRGIKDLMNMGVSKEMHLKCENCGAEFTSAINFNPSDFFAQGLPS